MSEDLPYVARGAVRQLWRIEKWPRGIYQILLEGPAGTGKSRGLQEWIHYMCGKYAGIRVLFLRKTKESLAESTLDTWENHVLWRGHPCITGAAGVRNRQTYTFPNGSHIVLGGLKDKAQRDKTLSTQYDIVVIFEGRDVTDYDSYQMLARCNRNWKIPWQLRIVDTNPGPQFHMLNMHFPDPEKGHGGAWHRIPREFWRHPPFTIKCKNAHVTVIPRPESIEPDDDGKLRVPCPQCGEPSPGANMFRLLSKFQDNPVMWDAERGCYTEEGAEYVEGTLAQLEGGPYANLYLGKWRSEEGIIYQGWDPEIHVVQELPEQPKWYFGSFDKGIRHPGCLQVWGVIGDDRMYLVKEIYRTEENIDWWAEQVVELDKEYWLQAIACDHELDYMAKFNDFLGERRGRHGHRIARPAKKDILTGIDMVRWALSKRDGGPRLFVLAGCNDNLDQKRVAAMKPASLLQEIGSYVWKKAEPDQAHPEKPDPTCADHAMDCMRYAAMFLWGHDLTPVIKPRPYAPNEAGYILKYDEVMRDGGGWGEELPGD